MTFHPIVWQVNTTLDAVVKYASENQWKFVCNIVACVVVLLAFMLRRYLLRRKIQVARRFAAQLEESREFTQEIRQTQACEASVSPPERARPPKLQTLCLAVLCENVNRFYPLLEDFLKEEQNGELPGLLFHRVMMACAEVQMRLLKESSNSIQNSEASQENANQVDKEMPEDLVKMADPKESIQHLSREAAKWTEGAQEMGEPEQGACVKIEIHE